MHVFADESKAGPYLLIAAAVPASGLREARGVVRGLHLPNQSRLHMTAESDSRRRAILDTFQRAGLRATVLRATGYKRHIDARTACIDVLVRLMSSGTMVRLTFECDRSQDERDRRQLYRLVRELGRADCLQYEHRPATAEPLLAIPDAIGWAYARGGDFRKRARPMVDQVIDV